MLVLGYVGWGASLSPTQLTPDEQYSHISLWSLLASPLLLGCDMERLDDFTLNLITNDEVIAVNQDVLGKQAVPVVRADGVEIWVKELEDGGKAAGIFYLGNQAHDPVEMFNWDNENYSRKVTVDLAALGFTGKCTVRDLWRQKELGTFSGSFNTEVPFHGVVLVKITAAE
jgi:alpha-galactosidase